MNAKLLTILGSLIIGGLSLGYFLKVDKVSRPLNTSVSFGTTTIMVEIAWTPEAWEQGLSGRTMLATDTGMLFVFDREDHWAIWMKDMNFPLDIIWISKDKKVVKVEENATPESYTNGQTIFEPEQNVLYVLEVPAGTVKNAAITLGDVVKFMNI